MNVKKPSISPYNRSVIGDALWMMMLELTGRKTKRRKSPPGYYPGEVT